MYPFLLLLSGCDLLSASLKSVKVPTAELSRVDLVQSPSSNQALAWGCYEFTGSSALCQSLGFNSRPTNDQMLMSFDLVFNLTNNNELLSIPLVEVLLAITVIEDTNLGAVCISFCDPDVTSCAPGIDAEGACTVDGDTVDINRPEDLVPTVDELLELAESVAEGEIDNGDWRFLPPLETVEGHIQFDLNVDTTLELTRALISDAVDDFIAGRNVRMEVPYSVEGTLFFEVPETGHYGVNFGPFEDAWPLE